MIPDHHTSGKAKPSFLVMISMMDWSADSPYFLLFLSLTLSEIWPRAGLAPWKRRHANTSLDLRKVLFIKLVRTVYSPLKEERGWVRYSQNSKQSELNWSAQKSVKKWESAPPPQKKIHLIDSCTNIYCHELANYISSLTGIRNLLSSIIWILFSSIKIL